MKSQGLKNVFENTVLVTHTLIGAGNDTSACTLSA